MKCPICKKDVEAGSRYAPFCSERCRTIDLGNWAAEKYRIPSSAEPEPEEEDEDEEPRNRGAGGQ
jgi:endogenous inhibitor of DNA gyrase (YacG/DUF329 family)